mgnify:CR=1 FL=1
MEDRVIFSGTTCVEIQGPRVLRFIGLTEDSAEFEVIGLSNPKVRVFDKRPAIIKAMKKIIDSGEVHTLTPLFNTPARVTLSKEICEGLSVKLEKTRAKKPRHMLWVAIGMEKETLPRYWYVNVQVQKMENEKFALFSLYKRPHQKKKVTK